MKKAWNYFRRYHIFFFLPVLVFAAIIGPYTSSNLVLYTFIAIYSFSYYIDSRRGRTNIAERRAIARKGLTYIQMRNLKFAKKWAQIRTAGRVKYIFVFGGLCFGFGLCFVFCFVAMDYVKGTMDFIQQSPGNMFTLIACCYLAGFFIADTLYLILWNYNEQKFIRLTDPLH